MDHLNSASLQAKNNSLENSNLFRKISLKIADLGTSVGIKIIPFHNPNLVYFSKLDESSQQRTLKALQAYLNIYESVRAEGASILNCSRVVWNALLQLGYRPTSDLFSYMHDDYLIEIHDNNLIQVFRNLSFFNYCSYSLEELYCHQLTELYERDANMEKDLMRLGPLLFSGQLRNVVDPNLKPHIIQEKMSSAKLAVLCHVQKIAPLFASSDSNSSAVAALTIEKAEIVEAPSRQAEIIPLSSRRASGTETPLQHEPQPT